MNYLLQLYLQSIRINPKLQVRRSLHDRMNKWFSLDLYFINPNYISIYYKTLIKQQKFN